MLKTAGCTGIQSALSVEGSAVTLTVPTGATRALIQNTGAANLRYRSDGGVPTASVGNRLVAGSSLNWTDPDVDFSADIARFQAIRETATSTTLDIAYYTYS